ncbi:MAG: hypothetical protein A7315_13785 [Candidatus Altiarchaeales archaeon WOR_SM1_79]|nr:MAG: hypothetical protein A7315_13785 [Candidatus Altiarchaeales archaeon WOR_SM1_79]
MVKFLCCNGIEEFKENLRDVFPYKHNFELIYKTYIEDRFEGFLREKVKTFVIEHPYIEKEWRELYSLHYCKTNYSPDKTNPFAFRIHLIEDDIDDVEELKIDQNNSSNSYIGYLTLRPLPANIISKIVIKPRKYFELEKDEELFMITAKYTVNIKGRKIKFNAFPLFCQDAVVTVCIHTTGMMLSDIMHRRYGNNKMPIEKMVLDESPHLGRKIPSRGITVNHLSKILIKNGYYVRIKNISSSDDESKLKDFMGVIDAYIESGLPCMLIFDEHLVTITGHTFDKDKGVIGEYIIFDESGSHIKKYFGKNKPLFSVLVKKEDLVNEIKSLIEKKITISLLYPEFERFYFPFEKVEGLIKKIIKQYFKDPKDVVRRIVLVDCKKLVRFLLENNIKDFEDVCFPHYLWYIELYYKNRGVKENLGCCMIIDASAHQNDKIYSIFLTKDNKPVFNPKDILSLLKTV